MTTIRLETLIRAPLERCFNLARDSQAHVRSAAGSHERIIDGPADRHLVGGDQITFEARHFGIRWRLTAKITRFEPPALFEDAMVRGLFHSLRNTHEFRSVNGATLMVDTFCYRPPLGPLGRLADRLFLEHHLRRFLTHRTTCLRHLAENTEGDQS